jgi:hypothetical protein
MVCVLWAWVQCHSDTHILTPVPTTDRHTTRWGHGPTHFLHGECILQEEQSDIVQNALDQ